MAKIIWEGNQEWDREFDDEPLPGNAKRLERPDDILKASLPYGIVPGLICFLAVMLKAWSSGDFIFKPWFIPLSFVIGFLLIPVHEYLHAVCYPREATVFVGLCLKKVAAYAVSFYPISRGRFVVMSLAPVVLGIIPLVIFILCPADMKAVLTVCVVPSFMGLISPSPDYMDVILVLRQVPRGARIQASNEGLFWFE